MDYADFLVSVKLRLAGLFLKNTPKFMERWKRNLKTADITLRGDLESPHKSALRFRELKEMEAEVTLSLRAKMVIKTLQKGVKSCKTGAEG